jgi:hypothetical protein
MNRFSGKNGMEFRETDMLFLKNNMEFMKTDLFFRE